MSKYIPGNQKHLTLENRIYIENELNKGTSFKDIARFLCKDPTTISKEVRAHRLSDWYHKSAVRLEVNVSHFLDVAGGIQSRTLFFSGPFPIPRNQVIFDEFS